MRWGPSAPRWPYGKWTGWFAWYPVQLNDCSWVWLERVECSWQDSLFGTVWSYRLPR
jgi:hypothetical protein